MWKVLLGATAAATVAIGGASSGAAVAPMVDQDDQFSGTVALQITNQTSGPVPINWLAQNMSPCETNTFSWPGGSSTDGASTLQAGQSGVIDMYTSSCPGVTGQRQMEVRPFRIGIVGQSQFQFSVNVDWVGTGTAIDFANFAWEQDYTAGGNTGNMYQYNCGSGQLLGGGSGNDNGANYDYTNGTSVCFVIQDGAFNAQQAMQ